MTLTPSVAITEPAVIVTDPRRASQLNSGHLQGMF
jgi:hypothetical protein